MARSLQEINPLSSGVKNCWHGVTKQKQRGTESEEVRINNVPAVHIQVHPLSFLKPAEVSCHLGLLHGLALQVAQPLDKLDALVVFAADEGLFSRLQIQFLEGRLSQKAPGILVSQMGRQS